MKRLFLYSLALLMLNSCNQWFVDDSPGGSPQEVFEVLWKEFDENYCFFAEKNINWDSVKTVYQKKIRTGMDDRELYSVLASMLGELKDGHVNLIAPFNISMYWDWYLDYPANFNMGNIERHYLGKDRILLNGMQARLLPGHSLMVGYVSYGSFMNFFDAKSMEILLGEEMAKADVLIFDIRGNGGGLATNMFDIASHFTDQERVVGYTRFKAGKGHHDFSQWYPETIKPAKVHYTRPVYILTNRESYSAANIFPGMMKALPNVTIVGDTTGGGGASPRSFDLPNGWVVRQSGIVFAGTNYNTLEFGVAPDLYLPMNPSDEAQGKDTMIEYVLSLSHADLR